MERKNKENKNIARVIVAMLSLAFYAMGGGAYSYSLSQSDTFLECYNLMKRKNELIKKTDEWQRYIPTMKEHFYVAYQDSLNNAIKNEKEISLKIKELEKEIERKGNKSVYSWLAFFMD